MDRSERTGKEDAQKAKLIFFSLAGLVIISLIWSVASASKARSERNAVMLEMDLVKSDNIKLEQMIKELTRENENLRKKVQQLENRAKTKAKPAAGRKKSSKGSKKKSGRKQVLLYN